MRGKRTVALAALVVLATVSVAGAQLEIKQNPGSIKMESVGFLGQNGITGEVVRGKKPPNTNDWRTSVIAEKNSAVFCSGTLVGPYALLLAAHCVGHLQLATVKLHEGNITGQCKHAPEYLKGDKSADYALCKLTKRAPSDMRFERVLKDRERD
jgi:hypothetical protein